MDKKYGEFVGVDSLYYALVTKDDDGGYVAGTPTYLAPTAEISGEAETNNTPTYYDNKPGNNYVSEGVTTLNITVANVPAILMAILLGKTYDAATGLVYDSGQPIPPDVAIGFRYNMGRGHYRYYWYLKGTFSGGAEEAASKSNDVDIRTYQLTFTAVATTHEWMVNGEMMSLKRVFADTANTAFDPAGWFAQVRTPDVSAAPAVLALTSSSPADKATGVSRSGSVGLTFTNAIQSETVTLLSGATGDAVTVTKSWDSTGKVLTITPSSTLAATAAYIVVISGVTDVYGQRLAVTSRTFTTGA